MKLTIEQSLENTEVEITIKCGLIDDKLQRLISQIRLYSFSLQGKKDGTTQLIPLEKIYYFESIDEKTFIYCDKEVFQCDLKLYEIEQQLVNTDFVRISKSSILNIGYLQSVKPLLNGKMEAHLTNKEKLIINRHFVASFKEKFGIKEER